MGNGLVTVGEFSNTALAAIARNKLEAAGIRALILDAGGSSMPFFAGFALVQLQVAEKDADRALDVLEVGEDGDASAGAFTEEPPGPDPEDMEPEIPEEKPTPYKQTAPITRGVSPRDAIMIGAILLLVLVLALFALPGILFKSR